MPSYYDERGRGTASHFSFGRRQRRRRLIRTIIVGVAALIGIIIVWNVAFSGDETPVTPDQAIPSTDAMQGDGNAATGTGTGTGTGEEPNPPDGGEPPVSATGMPPEIQQIMEWGLPIYCGGGRANMVALTFDDGPGPYTQKTLDYLRSRGAKATFFLAGKLVEGYAKLAREEARFSEVADHSMTHFGLSGEPQGTLQREVAKPKRIIEDVTDQVVWYFRPPWGSRDKALDEFVQSEDMISVMWSLDSLDATTGTNTDDIIKNVDKGLSSGDIILMHENRGTTQNALPQILDMIEAKGLRAVNLTTLLTQDTPTRQEIKQVDCEEG
ncbi:MAG: polysaccharide deacetylase family protein [Actinomycetota bacterium]